jgi:hypothetical protein
MARNSLSGIHKLPKIAFEGEDTMGSSIDDDSTVISSSQLTEHSVINTQPTRCN